MNIKELILASAMVFPGICGAADEGVDIEARRNSIHAIEEHIKEREAQMTDLGNDVLRLHQRIDGRLEQMVGRLASISDSSKSGFRVSKLKLELIEGLRESVEAYQSKRAAVFQDIRDGRSGIPKEILEGEVEHYDEYVEKHIEQILAISKSFTQDENVEKYEQDTGDGYYVDDWGWGWDSGRISDEYRQNRRDRIMDKKQRDEVIAALRNSISRCESLVAGLRDDLGRGNLPASDREMIQAEINRHEAMLKTRRTQLDDLVIVEKPVTSPLSRDVAADLADSLEDLAADLQQDLRTIFTKHAQLRRERFKIFKLQSNLHARRKWIEEYESKAGDDRSDAPAAQPSIQARPPEQDIEAPKEK